VQSLCLLFVREWSRPDQGFLTETSQSCRGVRIRLDFCRKARIATGDARADQRLVADNPETEAHQDRREGSHGRYVAFQMAEVAISRHLFADILQLIAELRPPPDPAPA
jgi:hypothetical protein